MTKIFTLFSERGNKCININTGVIVVTTGNHGDKSKGYTFEAYRIINNNLSDKPEWFRKILFIQYHEK